jgi:hypothetical protein
MLDSLTHTMLICDLILDNIYYVNTDQMRIKEVDVGVMAIFDGLLIVCRWIMMKTSLTPWVLVTHKHNQIAQLESNQLHQLSIMHQQ